MHRVVALIALAATGLYGREEMPDHRLRTSTAALHESYPLPTKAYRGSCWIRRSVS